VSRTWMILDAFNTPQGPFTEDELVQIVVCYGDVFVMTDGMLHWQRATDIPDLGRRPSAEPRPTTTRRKVALDAHGQPLQHRLNAARCADRDIQELLGLMKGVLADGHVCDAEVVALEEWTTSHPWAHDIWPVNVLVKRLKVILDDGIVDEEERRELTELLQKATGERPDASTAMNGATRLPLDDPPPPVGFEQSQFVFTGKFAYGTRRRCEDAVVDRGGATGSSVTRSTNFVVIGTLASAQWALSSYGRKIQKAVELRSEGVPIAIVSEEHWVEALV